MIVIPAGGGSPVEPVSDEVALASWFADWDQYHPDIDDPYWEDAGEEVDFAGCSSVPAGSVGWLAPLVGLFGIGRRRRR